MFNPDRISKADIARILLSAGTGFVTYRAKQGSTHSKTHNRFGQIALVAETGAGIAAVSSVIASENYADSLRKSSNILLTVTAGCFVGVGLTDGPLRRLAASGKRPSDFSEYALDLARTFRRNTNL